MSRADEEEERRRQEGERSRLSVNDRLYGTPVRTSASGFIDGRSRRRTGRVIALPIRVQPRVRAMIEAIMRRDAHVSIVELFEVMLEAYQQVHGAIAETELPSDEAIVAQLERERDQRDGQ